MNDVNFYKGAERRRFTRIPFGYVVKYRTYDSSKQMIVKESNSSRTKNISLGGILLETEKAHTVSSMLEVELCVPLDAERHVYAKVLGKVARSVVIEPDKSYDTAVEFISIPDEYKCKILQLIEVFS